MENTASFYLANVGSIPAGRAININMNILIIGDSWGVPNYPPEYYGLKDRRHIGDPPETHTEFLLRAQGHRVTNCAINASGNYRSILEGLKHAGQHRVDWIIWFHTEMLRDSHLGQRDRRPYMIQNLTEEIAVEVYQLFRDLQIKAGAKAAIIGGQAPVLDNFYHITSADWVKTDWRSEILGQSLPVVHSLCTPHLIESSLCRDSIEDRIRLLDQHRLILDAMAASPDFPDLCHPGREPHRKLVEWILKIFENRIPPVI